jgi:hypothetical protein
MQLKIAIIIYLSTIVLTKSSLKSKIIYFFVCVNNNLCLFKAPSCGVKTVVLNYNLKNCKNNIKILTTICVGFCLSSERILINSEKKVHDCEVCKPTSVHLTKTRVVCNDNRTKTIEIGKIAGCACLKII